MDASRQHDLPRLALVAAICIGLLFGGIAIGVALGGVLPLPDGPAAAVEQYVRASPTAIQVIAVPVFASSVPLAVYAATASAQFRHLGVAAPAATIALTGGLVAAGALGLTGLLAWTLSRPEVSGDTALVTTFYYLVFLVGGAGHIVALGLLVGGMAISGQLSRLVARAGLAIAGLCELTTLVLVWPVLGPILPVARVAALAWLVVAGAQLPLRRNGIRSG